MPTPLRTISSRAITVLMVTLLLSGCGIIRETLGNVLKAAGEQNQEEEDGSMEDLEERYLKALRYNWNEVVKECIADGAGIQDAKGYSPLLLSAIGHDGAPNLYMVEYLLERGADPNAHTKEGLSVIMALIPTNGEVSRECLRLVLAQDVDINYVGKEGRTALDYAASWRRKDIVELLIDHGATVRKKTLDSTLERTDWTDVYSTAQLILQQLVDTKQKTGLDPLLEQAILGDEEEVQHLLRQRSPKKLEIRQRKLFWQFTGAYGTTKTLDLLKRQGIDWAEEKEKELLLEGAIYGGNIPIWELTKSDDTREDLKKAIGAGQSVLVKYMLDSGVSIIEKEQSAIRAGSYLRTSSKLGDVQTLNILIENKYPLNDNNNLYYAVDEAIIYNQLESLKYFAEHGYDVDVPHKTSGNPFDSVWACSIDTTQFLLDHGAAINGDQNDGSAFWSCLDYPNIKMAKFLIEKGASTNLRVKGSNTNLCTAVDTQDMELIKIIVENGADVNEDNYGNSALIKGAMSKNIVAYLIEQGADVNKQQREIKRTPLIWAVNYGNLEGVRLLLEAGADYTVQDAKGKTALDYARELNCPKIEALLTQAMQKKLNP